MSAKTATVRLYVAIVSLVTGVITLAGALVDLLGASILALTSLVARHIKHDENGRIVRPAARREMASRSAETAPAAPPALKLVPKAPPEPKPVQGPSQAERLTTALIGMGWHASSVREWVKKLGDRVERDSLQTLIREGLAHLSARAS